MTDSRAYWTARGTFPASFCAHSRYAVDLLEGDGTKNEEEHCNLGIKTAANAHVREIFIETVEKDAAELGLSMPEPRKGKRSSYRPLARPEQQAGSAPQASATSG